MARGIKQKKNPETLTNWNGKDRWLMIHRVEGEVGDKGRGRIKNDSKPRASVTGVRRMAGTVGFIGGEG